MKRAFTAPVWGGTCKEGGVLYGTSLMGGGAPAREGYGLCGISLRGHGGEDQILTGILK